jgi:hypothetical protein
VSWGDKMKQVFYGIEKKEVVFVDKWGLKVLECDVDNDLSGRKHQFLYNHKKVERYVWKAETVSNEEFDMYRTTVTSRKLDEGDKIKIGEKTGVVTQKIYSPIENTMYYYTDIVARLTKSENFDVEMAEKKEWVQAEIDRILNKYKKEESNKTYYAVSQKEYEKFKSAEPKEKGIWSWFK